MKQSLARIEEAFRAALAASGHSDPRRAARFVTAGVQGLRLYGKANPDRASLEDIAATLLLCLD